MRLSYFILPALGTLVVVDAAAIETHLSRISIGIPASTIHRIGATVATTPSSSNMHSLLISVRGVRPDPSMSTLSTRIILSVSSSSHPTSHSLALPPTLSSVVHPSPSPASPAIPVSSLSAAAHPAVVSVVSVTSSSHTTTSSSTTRASSTSTTSAVPTGFDLFPPFIFPMLKYHNLYRSIHSAPALIWDPAKALFAQNHADKCNFSHSGGPYGENLAIGGFSDPALYIWLWYNERSLYTNYAAPNFTNFAEWGHFTQLVWESTTSIGCGYANNCENFGDYGPYYLVCEYDTGNVLPIGHFVDNVLPGLGPVPKAPAGMATGY